MKIAKYIIIIALFFSCQKLENVEKPRQLIKKEQMVEILSDLAIYSASKSQDRKLVESKNVDIHLFLSNKYNIDTTTLKQNIDYYASDLETYMQMQEQVKAFLEKEKKKYDRINVKEERERKKKLDSLKKAHDQDSITSPKEDKEELKSEDIKELEELQELSVDD
ncbi:MAG: DUF4296 domain-containing protein [Flavobacteriaceae bacterium]|nr:DUF4296 domain-containing protein [Flavobacteriaceae bacterium]